MNLRMTCCLAVLFAAADVRGQLLTNGSFESPIAEARWETFTAGEVFADWSVGSGDVDIFRAGQEPYEGQQSLDLNGTEPGSLWQDVDTIPGADYTLNLAYAGQPGGRNQDPVKTFRVDFGTFSWTQMVDTTGRSLDNLGWQPLSLTIPGTDISETTTRLSLTSVGSGSTTRGPTLDSVELRTANAPPDAASLIDGTFEAPVLEPLWQTFAAGQVIDGWTVGSGDVDLFFHGQVPFDGRQSLDLNGEQPGSIWQDVTTAPGQDYLLELAYAGQPGGSFQNPIKSFRIGFGDFSWSQSFDTTGHSFSDLGWQQLALLIPGSDISETETRLTITSIGAGSTTRGPTIDAITLRAIPEPTSICLLISAAICTVAAHVYRKRGIPHA